MTPVFFRVDQRSPTPVSTYISPKLNFRYAFDRSSDSIKANEPGQDYLAICAEGQRLAFTLCDGVSQSFFGDLAARTLGDGLVEWLWTQVPHFIGQNTEITEPLSQFLNHLNVKAATLVANYPLPDNIPSILQVVLEKKRTIGSESMFAAGYLDLDAQVIHLAWMGDIRLRVWTGQIERTMELLGPENFQTRERWSSNRGPLGAIHTAQLSTNDITRVLAYSDGLAVIDKRINRGSPSNTTLQSLINESKLLSTSDDISLVEIWMGETPGRKQPQPKTPRQVKVSIDPNSKELISNWTPVSQATDYELALITPHSWRMVSTSETHWAAKADEIPPKISSLAIRAWREEEAGPWSRPISVHLPVAASRAGLSDAEVTNLFSPTLQPGLVKGGSSEWPDPGPRRLNRLRITLVGLICVALALLAVILWVQAQHVSILPDVHVTASVTAVNPGLELPVMMDSALVSTVSP